MAGAIGDRAGRIGAGSREIQQQREQSAFQFEGKQRESGTREGVGSWVTHSLWAVLTQTDRYFSQSCTQVEHILEDTKFGRIIGFNGFPDFLLVSIFD